MGIPRALLGAACGLGLAAACGCIDTAITVAVNKDGSGLVFETTYLSPMLTQMLESARGGEANYTDEERAKAKAATMGEGVRFVSAMPAEKRDGSKGMKAVYEVADIRKLRIDMDPESPGAGAARQAGGEKKKSAPITFDFTPGATAALTVHLNRQRDVAAEAASPAPAPDARQMAMLKEMLKGMRMQLQVHVAGPIAKTNASHVQEDVKTGERRFVTLFDMNVGKLVEDDAQIKKLLALGEIQNMDEAAEKIKGIPNLKIETAEQVVIEFQ